MATLYNHDDVLRCVIGTVGEPGERAFYLQVRSTGSLTTVALEKTQAGALVERLQLLIKELRKREGIVSQEIIARDDSPLDSPIDPDILAGNMAVMWLSDRKKIQIEIQEMKVNDISGEIDSPDFDNNDLGIEKDDLAMVRFALTLGQVKEFIRRSEAVIGSGRQPCMFCGLPINPDGHLCPRANGYRR
jgi:uncharacterized repeat protein (TIGR03847 family)